MLALRKLSAIYLLAASAYSVSIVLAEHPPLARAASQSAHYLGEQGAAAAVALNAYVIQPGWAYAKKETVQLADAIGDAIAGKKAPVQVAQKQPAKQTRTQAAQRSTPPRQVTTQVAKQQAKPQTKPVVVAEQNAAKQAATPPLRPRIEEPSSPAVVADNTPPKKKLELVPQAPRIEAPSSVQPPSANLSPTVSPAELTRVGQRLHDNLTPEMLDHFDLFLYVSKASVGPWAQHMYVYQKQGSGDLKLLYNWPVSTGREKIEFNAAGTRLPSITPAGYYQLDPGRFHARYHSAQWDQPMPYAMFFNWIDHGNETGLAIHGAAGEDIGLLGTRASAGCVRLAPENAKLLFQMIRSQYAGLVPKFAYDKKTATMANDGVLLHDRTGRLELSKGYKVLVFIENYGGSEVVAALF
jgi:hypothetical protein